MAKGPKPGEHIERLRKSLGMTQATFGNQFSVTQSRISEWEGDGPTEPSVEAWMKMAALALEASPGDPAEAVYLWEQTCIDSRFLISLAEAMLQTGEPGAEKILPCAEAILKERVGEASALKMEGKVILVPPYTQGEWKEQASMPPLAISADAVQNVSSTYYLFVEPAGYGPQGGGFSPKDRIVFDASYASTRRFDRFRDQVVVANLAPPLVPFISPQDGGLKVGLGLRIGRLTARTGGGVTRILLSDSDKEDSSMQIDAFSALPELPSSVQSEIRKGTRYNQLGEVVDRRASEELAVRTLPPGCDILGRFVAQISGGHTGSYEITEAQLRRHRREGGRT